jgi:hypothetical protein
VGTTQLGEETVIAGAVVEPTGVDATGQTGTVIVISKAVVNVVGNVGTTQLGSETVIAGADVPVTGVVGTGDVGNGRFTLVWGLIDTSQNANWVQIAA